MNLSESAPLQYNVSAKILKQLCVNWFKSRFDSTPWFPGEKVNSKSKRVDVVLFGDFVEQIVKSKDWPKTNFRIWVLSQSSRNVCIKLLGIPENAVGVIPRYELLSKVNRELPFPKASEKYNLIYSGRISPNKNIEFLIYVAFWLQKEFEHNLKLILIGKWDDIGPFENGFLEDYQFRARVTNLIKNLNWVTPPQIIKPQKPEKWMNNFKSKKNILISLSKYFLEDFGVSIAQAQVKGWPLILSEWGGHRDVSGANVISINDNLIGNIEDSETFTEGKAYLTAQQISREMKRTKIKKINTDNFFIEPIFLNNMALSEIRSKIMVRYKLGPSVFKKVALYNYSKLHEARNFFFDYYSAF